MTSHDTQMNVKIQIILLSLLNIQKYQSNCLSFQKVIQLILERVMCDLMCVNGKKLKIAKSVISTNRAHSISSFFFFEVILFYGGRGYFKVIFL